jgi:hypothetical protein
MSGKPTRLAIPEITPIDKITFGRTPMGEDLHKFIKLIEKCPPEQGRARAQAVAAINRKAQSFRERWSKDPFKLIEEAFGG